LTTVSRPPLWYKDAVFYELHVKTFHDSNGDGIGDFPGLIAKLDYIERLGVDCVWLLPFYESPLRDDGYDIAHYERVHPSYGTLADFKRFLDEAHARGIKVITELIINHTSDQHPWFQAARRAPAGSPKRDFYVWSDTDQKYLGARVIFSDTEPSNWTWDPVAGAYYWHRFFHHQPDLNFDNPHVREAVLKVMRFWLEMGVDGLRLDAVAHLFEREGTTCDNLPETHVFLRDIRADMDARFENRVLLAEVNQGPAEARLYFGAGDACHMAFHFPLMPRLFLALKMEDPFPIADIVRQTVDLPDVCQWAVFLRNHDELTLSLVTDEDRDFLYQAYASEPRMRLHLGIRRRLTPLLGNDRTLLELANALLLSLPGTPVLYYGDEIGMGDNIMLGDRDGVRTPMQWDSGPNGGFSSAEGPLVLPAIDNEVYGYSVVNVDAQERTAGSLLSRTKRMIKVRRRYPAFGRGSIEFLECGNRAVLAFLRRYDGEVLIVVANLSQSSQEVHVVLPPEFSGAGISEIVEGVALPPATAEPYALVLEPRACRWLAVSKSTAQFVPT